VVLAALCDCSDGCGVGSSPQGPDLGAGPDDHKFIVASMVNRPG
jgi:hypothetical protein